MMKITTIQPIATNEVVRAIKVALEGGKSFTTGFSATTPDFMIQRTNGSIASTTKSAVIASFKGHMDAADIKALAQHINTLRPVVFGKSTQSVNVFAKAPKQYKAHCACCGVGLTDAIIDYCNRKLNSEMVCFECQKGPKGPKKEGASEASALTPAVVPTSQKQAQDSTPELVINPKASEASAKRCWKCKGTGLLAQYLHIEQGACYPCNGTGFVTSSRNKTAPSKKLKESEVVDVSNEKTPTSEQSSAEVGVVIPNDAVAWTKSLEESLLESDLVADRS